MDNTLNSFPFFASLAPYAHPNRSGALNALGILVIHFYLPPLTLGGSSTRIQCPSNKASLPWSFYSSNSIQDGGLSFGQVRNLQLQPTSPFNFEPMKHLAKHPHTKTLGDHTLAHKRKNTPLDIF